MVTPLIGNWGGAAGLERRHFRCGFCETDTNYNSGFHRSGASLASGGIGICNGCNRPSYFEHNLQVPGAPVGRPVKHLPDNVGLLWNEARAAAKAGAPTAAVLLARTIVMHVAVAKGATENKSFVYYVDYLAEHHHVPVGAKAWVDRIRLLGNEATHEIVVMTPAQCEEALTFTAALLHMTYELEGSLPSPSP